MKANQPLIKAENIGLDIDGHSLLSNVSMEVHPEEIVCIIGPNGAGKTTLIRLLMGIEPISNGNIIRKKGLIIGYVPQKLPIDPTLPLPVHRLMTLTIKKPKKQISAALRETGIEHLINAQVCTLSGGEFQRVLLARALLREPHLLVLDEPVQGVDFAGEAELYELIKKIRDNYGCGVLLISHDLHVVMAATDRVICLNGHVCCAGSPDTVSRHPEFAQLLGGTSSKAYAIYSHQHSHDHSLSGKILNKGDKQKQKKKLKNKTKHDSHKGCNHDH
jgi:zinc transport system ATP-binding protein